MCVVLWVLAQGDVEEGKAASELLEEGHWDMDDEDEAADEGSDLAGEKQGEGWQRHSLTALIRRQLTHMVRLLGEMGGKGWGPPFAAPSGRALEWLVLTV